MTHKSVVKPKMITEFDSPWKSILEIYFADFLALCWPQAYTLIDWNIKPIMLDKELQSILQGNAIGKRIADKLVRVFLKDGADQFILMHVEVQGSKENNFAERMYIYNYRIQDKFNQSVASVALLIDSNSRWRPTRYISEFCGSKIEMTFHLVKILDYVDKEAELNNSDNTFAAVILAQLAAIKAKKLDIKLDIKLQLIRNLFKSGRERADIINLLKFIDWIIMLNKYEQISYETEIIKLDKELKMEYVPTFSRADFYRGIEQGFEKGIAHGMEQGLEQGIEQGLEQGIEQGIEQGMLAGERMFLTRQLEHKFGHISTDYLNIIHVANSQQLLAYANRVLDCTDIAEVFKN